MSVKYGVVDLFAGPGGLAEGFAKATRADGSRPYSIELSIEKEKSAHKTLTLRSFLRQFDDDFPQEYYDALNTGNEHLVDQLPAIYPDQWMHATNEAVQWELGKVPHEDVDSRLDCIRDEFAGNTILIGGPPCQAYSLVGRSRNMGIADYVATEDKRHYLYQEYIRILNRLQPAAFVMENVKGILSSRLGEELVFERILDDLRSIQVGGNGYELVALQTKGASGTNGQPKSTDFVVRTEDYGVPQARHRVIVVGIRPDIAAMLPQALLHGGVLKRQKSARVIDVLGDMPRLRSGLTREDDNPYVWRKALCEAAGLVVAHLTDTKDSELFKTVLEYAARARTSEAPELRSAFRPNHLGDKCPRELTQWIVNPRLDVLVNNETRGHMRADLARYFFAAAFADVEVHDRSPKALEYPSGLSPLHKNWQSGKFADRFRVQRWGHPSSTVTSHIAKDGHYFIHPDPLQCRSLTVREAARLQTFPDDYLFLGKRTQQYVQVGNAVPPFLAKQIAESVVSLLESIYMPTLRTISEEQTSYL